MTKAPLGSVKSGPVFVLLGRDELTEHVLTVPNPGLKIPVCEFLFCVELKKRPSSEKVLAVLSEEVIWLIALAVPLVDTP